MAWYPGARRRQIEHNFSDKTTSKNAVILHTTASATAESMFGWFNNPDANASSHFHVADDGTVEQYIDTALMSWASGEGNSRSVSIETQGDGSGPWTSAQLAALVELVRWICETHSIAVEQMVNSDDRGIGWHRLGVDGDFPDGLLGGRQQTGGSETWSSSYGKTCPGDQRIHQIPGILEQVKGGTDSAAASADDNGSGGHDKPWPDGALTVVGEHNEWTHKAWTKLLADVGFDDDDLTVNFQEWLAQWPRYDVGPADGDFGPRTTKALQRFLAERDFYSGYIDGDRGELTVKAEVRYLNSQRTYY